MVEFILKLLKVSSLWRRINISPRVKASDERCRREKSFLGIHRLASQQYLTNRNCESLLPLPWDSNPFKNIPECFLGQPCFLPPFHIIMHCMYGGQWLNTHWRHFFHQMPITQGIEKLFDKSPFDKRETRSLEGSKQDEDGGGLSLFQFDGFMHKRTLKINIM